MSERNVGLDCVRAVAIWLVMASHALLVTAWHGSIEAGATVFYGLGTVGVEIFFCLSGFLIGRILLDIEARGLSWDLIGRFFVRRWMRTLPLYYAYLAIRFSQDPTDLPTFASFLTFSQSFAFPLGSGWFFPHSWSLAVEEWSYLLLPMLAMAFIRTSNPVLLATSVLIGAGWLYRLSFAGPDWWHDIRSVTMARLDAIGYGVLAAYFVQNHVELTTRYWRHAAIGGAVLAISCLPPILHQFAITSTAERVALLPLFAIGVLAMLPAAERISISHSVIAAAIGATSRLAYSLYIWNLMAAMLLLATVSSWPLSLQLVTYVLINYAVAWLFFELIERPFMARRPPQFAALREVARQPG